MPRIGVLVKMRAVEVREAVSVVRKMRRHPIENHADAVADADSSIRYIRSCGVP